MKRGCVASIHNTRGADIESLQMSINYIMEGLDSMTPGDRIEAIRDAKPLQQRINLLRSGAL